MGLKFMPTIPDLPSFSKDVLLICAVVAIWKGAWLVLEPLHQDLSPLIAGGLLILIGSIVLILCNRKIQTVIQ